MGPRQDGSFEGSGPSGPQCRHERLNSQNRYHSLQVIRKHMQTHLGSHARERLGKKVGGAHPRLERPEWMLRCLPAHAHRFRMRVETRLHRIEYRFMLPAFNTTLHALRALRLDRATRTRRAPIGIQCASVLNAPITPDQRFAGRAAISVAVRLIVEAIPAK